MNSYNECTEIVELDLDPIKFKLMHDESGEGWTLEQANAVEAEYRRFLYMSKIFPDEKIATSDDVDTFWHYHILDTLKYAEDCKQVFGYFLHHFPYVGLRSEQDLATLMHAGERMALLYEEAFGEKYQWSPTGAQVSSFTASHSDVGGTTSKPAYCMATGGGTTAKPAYCMATGGGTTAKPAYCMATGGGTTAKPAYCMATGGGSAAHPAYCMSPTGGTSAKPAYCMSTGGSTTTKARTINVNADETDFPSHAPTSAFSKNAAVTVADRHISMNTFFTTRPRLPVQAIAN